MKKWIQITLLGLISCLNLTSCLIEEPKKKPESLSSSDDYEKVIDEMVGVGSLNPRGIQVGQHDIMVQTLTISNNLAREQFRRSLRVLQADHSADGRKNEYLFEVQVIQRDSEGNVRPPTTETRKLVLAVNSQGYYELSGDKRKDYTLFSWDFIFNLRGFCQSFVTEDGKYQADVQCSNLKLTSSTWGPENIPVRKLTLNRHFAVTDLTTGEKDESKLHFTIQIASGAPEISKVVSYCSEGPQKFNNQVYYIVSCNNIESMAQ